LAALAYVDAYQYSGDVFFKTVADEIIEYVLRDLKSPDGAFYSAQDADSEGVEGKFYVWSEEAFVGATGRSPLREAFHVERDGNFSEEASGHKTYQNILYLERPLAKALQNEWRLVRPKLFQIRQKRVPPGTDTKILTAWNSLMISALCRAGQATGQAAYVQAGQKAMDFILGKLISKDGRLLRSYNQGKAQHLGVADDYAFLSGALLDLYEASLESHYLEKAAHYHAELMRLFADNNNGGLYLSGSDAPVVLMRQKEYSDGAVPAASSLAFHNGLRLYRMTGQSSYQDQATALLQSYAGQVNQHVTGFSRLMQGLLMLKGPSQEIVVSGRRNDREVKAMLATVRQAFLPNAVLLFHPDQEAHDPIFKISSFLSSQKPLGGKATAYVCENFACQKPVHSVEDLKRSMSDINRSRPAKP
jgi:uncharacterized protein YyaL (SSP411 family)